MKPMSLLQKQFLVPLLSLFGLYLMLRFQTINQGDPNLLWSPIIWIVASLICITPLWYDRSYAYKTWRYSPYVTAVLLALGLLFTGYLLQGIIVDHPIKAEESDVIPSLEVYVRRLLAGEKVYTAIPFKGYEVWPTYFPGMWLPYLLPELMGFDYRWMALGSFYLSISYMILSISKEHKNLLQSILMGLLPAFFIWQLMRYDRSIFAFSTELMPIGFYLWLIWGLYKKNIWIIGIFISLCTLSRYAYTLWMIPFIYVIWTAEGFRYLLNIGLVGISVILLLYIFPFFMVDPGILTDGLAYYGKTAEGQWALQGWQNDGDIPYHLANGRSMSYWFYHYVDGDHIAKLERAKLFHKLISLGTALVLTFVYYRKQSSISWNKYLILSLFLYLSIFYLFLYVPFSYLYMLPLMVGMMCWILYGYEHKSINKITNRG